MLITPTHHHRRLRAGAALAAFGLGLPVGMAPALAETLTAQVQVDVEASALGDADSADTDDEDGLLGAVKVDADISVKAYLDGLLAGPGGGAGGDVGGGLPALPATSFDGDLPLVGSVGSEAGDLSAEVLGLLVPGDGDSDSGIGLPGVGLPEIGLPDLGLPGTPGPGLPGLGLPNLGLPNLGLPNLGLPNLGLPGLGLPSLPDRLPSLVLPSVITAPSGQDDDPAVVNAGHVGPVGGLVDDSEGSAGGAPAPGTATVLRNQPTNGPVQLGGGVRGSLPRTGDNLRARALAAFGLLGLAGLGTRRRRSA